MPSGNSDRGRMDPSKMLGTLSVLKWVPDLDKVKETLDGNVPPEQGDIVSRGGHQWPKKPE